MIVRIYFAACGSQMPLKTSWSSIAYSWFHVGSVAIFGAVSALRGYFCLCVMIAWETCEADFEWDGSLLDIYVLDTDSEDWVRLFSLLRKYYPPHLEAETSWPSSADEVREAAKTSFRSWSFYAGQVLVVCRLFDLGRIEFDIDPREVLGQSELNSLCQFFQRLGDALGKCVILTPESFPDAPIITYDPKTVSTSWHQKGE